VPLRVSLRALSVTLSTLSEAAGFLSRRHGGTEARRREWTNGRECANGWCLFLNREKRENREFRIKRVDEVCRLRVSLRKGFERVLRTYTLSPHFVPTLCRLRFVSTLCPYALSNAKAQAAAVPQTRPFRPRPRCAKRSSALLAGCKSPPCKD
jgi:hypothetical protein